MRARVFAAFALAVVGLAATARANGDPASDVLLQAKVYFPNQRVSAEAANSLAGVVDAANAKGYPIRVALIRDESDLGTVPSLLNRAQDYAELLASEIAFAYKGDLLVVMPTGLGVTATDATAPPKSAVRGMRVEAGGSPDGLAETAEIAVSRLAAAAGYPLGESGAGGAAGTLVGVAVAAALLLLGLLGSFWLRRRASSGAVDGEDGDGRAPE